ncbi:D-glycero-alpha-D-manno-heptose-1,7-bisphosphate 7-phosphatase [Megalodesulfovibrio paquesii]
MPPAVFLDRDGVLIVDKHYLHAPDEVELLPGVAAGLRLLRDAGYELIVVSNQSGVGRGYFRCEDVDAVHRRLRELLAAEGVRLEHFYYCPHAPAAAGEQGCDCRKPAPGLIHQAMRELGPRLNQGPGHTPGQSRGHSRELTLEGACMIGDKRSDVALGQAVGIRTVLLTTGHGARELQRPGAEPDHVAPDLEAAARWLLEQTPQPENAAACDGAACSGNSTS